MVLFARCFPDPIMPPPGVMFHVSKLTKVYQIGEVTVHALRSIDLDLYEGELVVLLGPAGSGKSTLLNILGGLDVPSSGHCFFRDRNLTEASDFELTRFRRERVGFIFQFYNLLPSLTVRENVALVAEIACQSMNPEQALDLVGLGDRLHHLPSQLSGGEQQRVAIARAITKRPEVLLCDEPLGTLDNQTSKLVLQALAQVNQQLGITTVIVTHNAGIAGMADRMIGIQNGRITQIQQNGQKLPPAQLEW